MRSSSKPNTRQLIAINNPSAAGSTSSLLLDQMNLVLSSWKGKPLDSMVVANNNKDSRALTTTAATVATTANNMYNSSNHQDNDRIPKPTDQELQKQEEEIRKWIDNAVNHNVETCRSALMLYASATGPFSANLKSISDYLVDVILYLGSEVSDKKKEISELQQNQRSSNNNNNTTAFSSKKNQNSNNPAMSELDRELLGEDANNTKKGKRQRPKSLEEVSGVFEDEESKCEYAFSRLDHAKEQMRQMVEESHNVQADLKNEIEELKQKLERAETQLEYQIQRMRKNDTGRMDREEFERERSLLESNKQFERERERVKQANTDNDELRSKITELMDLNTSFARQAIELGARVRVYADHNERLATHLSLLTEEKSSIDRENEMIRAELLDLNRFHQLKDQFDGDKSKNSRTVDLRNIRYGKGANSTRPRHLQFTGIINRLTLTRQKVTAIVADVLMRRRVYLTDPNSTPMDLSTFFRDYMSSKHGNIDCVPWCYAVDEACEHNDDDVNLMLFQFVISNRMSELVYQDLARDVSILISSCEILDQVKNDDLKLMVSLGDIVGLLVEMFPGYPDSSHKKLLECLMQQLTSNSQVHYRMLFPNLEREEISTTTDGILSQSEMRSETPFSTIFKQLFIDDVMVTTQQFEDRIYDTSGDRVSWTDIAVNVESVFGRESAGYEEVLAMFRRRLFESFGKESTDSSFTVSKYHLMYIVRRKMLLRKSLFRPQSLDGAPKRAKLLLSSIGKSSDSSIQSIANEAGLSDFKSVLDRVDVQRRSFQEEEEKMLQTKAKAQALLATASSGNALEASASTASAGGGSASYNRNASFMMNGNASFAGANASFAALSPNQSFKK